MKKDATALKLAPSPTDQALAQPPRLELRIGVPRYGQISSLAKRAIDVGACILVFTVGAPVFLLLAMLVKASSRGPVFFRQTRIGRDGVPFPFYKFRTMHHGNDDSAHRDFCENFIQGSEEDGGQVFKMVQDPRVTRIGAFLRKTSLDEIPQFWNVLKGEMSIVGPRPPISYELEHYQDWHKDRLKVKPGLTGLWQVSGRSQVPFDEMVMLDLHYISHWSLALDFKIMWKTLPVMIKGDGAY